MCCLQTQRDGVNNVPVKAVHRDRKVCHTGRHSGHDSRPWKCTEKDRCEPQDRSHIRAPGGDR